MAHLVVGVKRLYPACPTPERDEPFLFGGKMKQKGTCAKCGSSIFDNCIQGSKWEVICGRCVQEMCEHPRKPFDRKYNETVKVYKLCQTCKAGCQIEGIGKLTYCPSFTKIASKAEKKGKSEEDQTMVEDTLLGSKLPLQGLKCQNGQNTPLEPLIDGACRG